MCTGLIQSSPLNSHSKCEEKLCQLSEHANYLSLFKLSNIMLRRVVSQTVMQIIWGMRISEGQIIRAILYLSAQVCLLTFIKNVIGGGTTV